MARVGGGTSAGTDTLFSSSSSWGSTRAVSERSGDGGGTRGGGHGCEGCSSGGGVIGWLDYFRVRHRLAWT